MTGLRGFTCWTQNDALKLLATEALEGNESLFLATHHPVSGFAVGGSKAALVPSKTEVGLLEGLTHSENRHVFCVVEGEPGSGKSHLIRWLDIKWPARGKRDLVLLIQRADGSLEGTLQSLRDELPERYRSIFDGLGRTSQVTEGGRRRDFQTKLANSMERDYFDKPPPDTDWCAQTGLSQILSHEKVRELWGAPRRILRILGGKGSSSEIRDQELARFTVSDVVQIGEMSREIRGVPIAAARWLRNLGRETDRIKPQLEQRSEDALLAEDGDEFPETLAFLQALDRRLNNAIQELLGTTARQLDELFKKLRRQLRTDDRRLVLLLEDVTNFQGVDEKLIDALVFNADTRGDDVYCDLISVLGVTPDYFRRYIETKSNYAQRITHHVRLAGGTSEDPLAFAVPFAARYLRAIRAGQSRLEGFDGGQVFNRCVDGRGCPHRVECHKSFGDHEGVGLYPFTGRAINRLFSRLADPSSAMTQQTPRGLIQNVLNPTLHSPDALDRGNYPHAAIETEYVQRLRLDGALRARIEQHPPGIREPLLRLITWWGESDRVEPSAVDERGNLLFQQVPRGVFDALGLPWPGAGDSEGAHPRPASPLLPPEGAPGPGGPGLPPPLVPGPVTPGTDELGPGEVGNADEPIPVAPPPPRPVSSTPVGRWELSSRELEKRRDQLAEWFEGTHALRDGDSFWNRWLHRLLAVEIPWRRLGVSPWLQKTLFSESTVMVASTKAARGNFVAAREAWVRDGLEAFVTLSTRPLPETDLDFHRYRLARIVRKLTEQVARHVANTFRGEEGIWSPVGLAAQVAVARAWLRGTLRPSDPLVEQWEYLFGPEPSPRVAPKQRVEAWSRLAGKTSSLPGELEKRLRFMVNLPQGATQPGAHGACDLAMADGSEAVIALRDLRKTLTFTNLPSPNAVKFDKFMGLAQKTAAALRDLRAVPRREGKRLLGFAEELERSSPGQSVLEHAERVQSVMVTVPAALPGAPNDAIQGWTQKYAELKNQGLFGPNAGQRADHLDSFKRDGAARQLEDFGSTTELLDWCIGVPADDVQHGVDLVRQGESSLIRVLAHADAVIAAAEEAGGTTLEGLKATATGLEHAATALLEVLGEQT